MARRLVTIEKLIERALEKGEGNLNGRKRDYGYVGALEEKYNVTIKDHVLRLRHWGTETLVLNLIDKEVMDWYGESNSDRDSMNCVLSYFNIDGAFRYFPSREEFVYEQ